MGSVTPILDSGALPPLRPKKRLLGVAIGFAIGILFAAVVANIGSPGLESGLAMLSYLPILALVVTIHELGHLIAGWSVGFHFAHISVGPLCFKIEYGRLKIQLRRDLGGMGFTAMHIETVRRVRRRLLIFIAAGPAVNLISGTLAGLFVYWTPTAMRDSWVLPFAGGFAVLSFVAIGLSLIPYGSAFRSDGARIWMLLASRNEARRWLAFYALGSQHKNGIAPRNWKRTWLHAVCAVRDGRSDELSGNLLAYLAASDRKDASLSAAHLERSLELARSLDCARRNFDAAIADWNKGTDFIKRLPETKVKPMLQESWQEWGEEIQQKQNPLVMADTGKTSDL